MQKLFYCLVIAFSCLPLSASAAAFGSYYLGPPSADYEVGQTITTTLTVGTDGQAVGAGEGVISYSTDTLELMDIRLGSTFTVWEQEPTAAAGRISSVGGCPNPGYNGQGALFQLVFRAKAAGQAQVKVLSGRLFLSAQPQKNILAGLGRADYNLAVPPPALTETVAPVPVVTAFQTNLVGPAVQAVASSQVEAEPVNNDLSRFSFQCLLICLIFPGLLILIFLALIFSVWRESQRSSRRIKKKKRK